MSRSSTTASSKGAGLVIFGRETSIRRTMCSAPGPGRWATAGWSCRPATPWKRFTSSCNRRVPSSRTRSPFSAPGPKSSSRSIAASRRALFSAADGVEDYVRELFQGPGWSIHRACCDNLAIGPDGVRYVAKPAVEARFTDFAAYEAYLLAVLASVVANGTDPLRRFRYELSSTCSSGSIQQPARPLQPSSGRGVLSRSAAPGAAARIQAAP